MINTSSFLYRWIPPVAMSLGMISGSIADPKTDIALARTSAPAQPQAKFAYVTNVGSRNITLYRVETTGALRNIGTLATGGIPTDIATVSNDKTGRLTVQPIYVVNQGTDSVSAYTIANTSTGQLRFVGNAPTGTNPQSIAIDPLCEFVLVANAGSNSISVFRINASTGDLSPAGTLPAEKQPVSVAFHPTGDLVYAVNRGSNNISTYYVDRGRSVLIPLGFTVPAGDQPSSLAVLPSGDFALVTNPAPQQLTLLWIPYQPCPLMIPVGSAPVNGGAASISIDRNGYIAAPIPLLNVVSIFRISSSGSISFVGLSPTGNRPVSVAIDPNGFVYVANRDSNDISMYAILPSGIPLSLGRVSAGTSPQSIALMF